MTEMVSLASAIIKLINPVRLIFLLSLFSLPLWGIYLFSPETYQEVYQLFPYHSFPEHYNQLVLEILHVLSDLCFLSLKTMIIIAATFPVQRFLRWVLGMFMFRPAWNESGDILRNTLLKLLFNFNLYSALLLTSIALYTNYLFDFHEPIKFLQNTSACWISIRVIQVVLGGMLLALIFP